MASSKPTRTCPRCKEKQPHIVKTICHACQNETGRQWKDGKAGPAPKTGGWADVHERKY